MADWREQLRIILRKVGKLRLKEGIQNTIDRYDGEFHPTIHYIRQQIPDVVDEEGKQQRYSKLRHRFEFDGLVADIQYLRRNIGKADTEKDRFYFIFQHAMHCGILHWWLREGESTNSDFILKLPEDLKWITDENEINRYANEARRMYTPFKRRPYLSEMKEWTGPNVSSVKAAWDKWNTENPNPATETPTANPEAIALAQQRLLLARQARKSLDKVPSPQLESHSQTNTGIPESRSTHEQTSTEHRGRSEGTQEARAETGEEGQDW